MEMQSIGKMFVLFGAVLVLAGVVMMFSDKIPYLGKLPGDIIFKKENFQLYFPLTTSILVSVLLSLVMWLISYLKDK